MVIIAIPSTRLICIQNKQKMLITVEFLQFIRTQPSMHFGLYEYLLFTSKKPKFPSGVCHPEVCPP